LLLARIVGSYGKFQELKLPDLGLEFQI
jgi:hypothetical protein